MGLQKGQSGYAFRWLTPIFSLVSSLMLIINAFVLTLGLAGFIDSLDFGSLIYDFGYFGVVDNIMTGLRVYVAFVWLFGLMMLALAIVAFVMNKKGAYIFATVAGGVTALTQLIKTIVYFWVYSQLKSAWLVGSSIANVVLVLAVYMLFIFAICLCVCLFGALAIPKCDYDKSIPERNLAGENLTYVGFENDPSSQFSAYHEKNAVGRVDPYAPPVKPVEEPPKREIYVPKGPTGSITGTIGMYRGAKFAITANEEIVIGRDPRVAQIVIGEGAQNVSREHCRISYSPTDNSYNVKDCSKNGTFSTANKTKLPHGVYTRVPAGTEIYLGDRSNMFRLG